MARHLLHRVVAGHEVAVRVVTHTGRFGDLLWALPSVRALAEVHGPVHLHVPGEFASLEPLLRVQPYIGEVSSDSAWHPGVDGWQAPQHPEGWHLGYRSWPTEGLPYATYRIAQEVSAGKIGTLDLTTPWIGRDVRLTDGWSYGFTETWFELKYGLVRLLKPTLLNPWVGHSRRWNEEASHLPVTWAEAMRRVSATPLLLTDCSALHVLGVGLGVPVVVMEPMEARWNPIFFPLGMHGPQVYVVIGGDGRPSFDARHTADLVRKVLEQAKTTR